MTSSRYPTLFLRLGKKTMRRSGWLMVLWAGLGFGWSAELSSAAEAPTPEQVRFFETNIRPLLLEHCSRCHSPEKQRAELRLDSRDSILKGGVSGPALVPGRPDQSLLIRAIRHQDELKMPPKEKLSDRQIADLTRWVQMGAPFPPAAAVSSGNKRSRDHWAFRPPVDPPVPVVKNAGWSRSPLDEFILAKLEAAGLPPAPPADKRTLIRRATFDLTGLPPTPAEIDAFLADKHPDAFARLVDRLLASPAYGERWGRHWLDVARYADSNGLDENVAHGNAWRYRDHVIAAFNQDKPYDRFLLEQVAGDLLPAANRAARHECLTATGLLALGPKVLAEVDERKMEMDIVDEQIDTLGRAFLGLTLGCARCHDHKFDPIDTEEYYALAGIFKSTRTMESFKKIARWHENSLATDEELARKTEHDRKIAAQKQAIQKLTQSADAQVKAAAGPDGKLPKDLASLYPNDAKAALKGLRDELAELEKTAPELPTAMGVTEGAVIDMAVHIRGNHLKLGKVVPRRVPQVLAPRDPPRFDTRHSGRLEMAQWLVRHDHPLTGRVMVNRIWRWHFGHGLVRTPDNFGLLGELPTHPELLDWLTRRFVEGGWSIKAMHRLIMLSSTYRMSSTPHPRTAAQDPDNRLHGWAEIRRLEAEALRDALLAVSGTLERTMGGSRLHVKNRAFVFDHTSRDATGYDARSRSVYLPIIRNNLYDVFQLLDFPDAAVPNGDRATTTVAPQALFLMNGELVIRASIDLAARLLQDEPTTDARGIQRLYALAYGREASANEVQEGQRFLREVQRLLRMKEPDAEKGRRQAWACLCQVILAANEFTYVK